MEGPQHGVGGGSRWGGETKMARGRGGMKSLASGGGSLNVRLRCYIATAQAAGRGD